jgi:hypothetical protein
MFRYDATNKEYEFNFLVKSGRQWGAIGFNPSGAGMIGTEIMWLGEGDSGPSLEYRKAVKKDTPSSVLTTLEHTP